MKFIKGQPAWNKGKKRNWKASGSFQKGHKTWNKGKPMSIDQRKKLSNAKMGKYGGEKCNLWKGGVTPKNKIIRTSTKYKQWRMEVFLRDNFTCQFCGIRNHIGLGQSVCLEAHHIKNFANYPELRFVIENGITLCRPCHDLTKKKK